MVWWERQNLLQPVCPESGQQQHPTETPQRHEGTLRSLTQRRADRVRVKSLSVFWHNTKAFVSARRKYINSSWQVPPNEGWEVSTLPLTIANVPRLGQPGSGEANVC